MEERFQPLVARLDRFLDVPFCLSHDFDVDFVFRLRARRADDDLALVFQPKAEDVRSGKGRFFQQVVFDGDDGNGADLRGRVFAEMPHERDHLRHAGLAVAEGEIGERFAVDPVFFIKLIEAVEKS